MPRKIIELTLQEFHLGSFVLEFFRQDYNNLGRFTQLCQTFYLFVCLGTDWILFHFYEL